MTFASGILLYKRTGNETWFLLGKEQNKWSSFAGSSESGETHEICANREFFEETCGIFGNEIDCAGCRYLKDVTSKGKEFTMFMVEYTGAIDICLNNKFRDAVITCEHNCMKEKTEIRWFHITKLHTLKLRNDFRNQIHSYLKIILNNVII